ncbi:MAG TPA: zinc-ribbon domain-containing protein [Jatrophihabitans sp.]
MIIFGFRSYLKLLAMLTLVCSHCHNPAAQRVVQVTRKFTLFFIPTFPIGRKRHITCTFCGASTRLTREQAEQLIAGAAGPAVSSGPSAPATPIAPPAG